MTTSRRPYRYLIGWISSSQDGCSITYGSSDVDSLKPIANTEDVHRIQTTLRDRFRSKDLMVLSFSRYANQQGGN
jgi:hypothetical protein